MNNKRFLKLLFIAGGTLTLAGALTQPLNVAYAPYIFSTGAALLIIFQLKSALDNKSADRRQRRLGASGFLSSVALGLAGYFMFTGYKYWVLMLLIYALSTLILTFRGGAAKQ